VQNASVIKPTSSFATSAAVGTPCPTCGAPLVRERNASPWCERCSWGLDRYDPAPRATWWQRRTGALAHRIAYRLTLEQFHALVGVGAVRAPRRLSGARLVTLVAALVFYAALAALVYLGVWLVRFRYPNPSIVFGVLVFAIVVYLMPRIHRLPRHLEPLDRDQAPALFDLIDRVAAAVGTRPPAIVCIDARFNASTFAVGMRRRRVLLLGLGLFGSLDPQQRVALLAHEFGHFANGDIRRGPLLAPVYEGLGRMADLFTGERSRVQFYGPRFAGQALARILDPIVDLILRVISLAFYAAHLGLSAVLLRDSQRREYLADLRAASIAGSAAIASTLDLLGSDVDSVVASRARAQEIYPAWRAAAAQFLAPANAARRVRLRQLSTRHDTSLWRTHPPTGLRAWLVEASGHNAASLVLTEAESLRIDEQLTRQYASARRDLAHSRM
jgi:Zn-dependent protease with chaperone function